MWLTAFFTSSFHPVVVRSMSTLGISVSWKAEALAWVSILLINDAWCNSWPFPSAYGSTLCKLTTIDIVAMLPQ